MSNVGNCKICSSKFKFKTRGSRTYKSEYCSTKCLDFNYRKLNNFYCLVCNKSMVGIVRKTHYCSTECSNIVRARKKKEKNMSRNKTCPSCMNDFIDTGKNNQKEFCSNTCLNIGQKARSYKINPSEYFKMKSATSCPMCKNEFNSSSRIQCIDHCHSTGKVRGLICRKCNTTLGQIGDDIPTLERLARYLEVHRES